MFVRQVVAELRKVIWPTRKELITYTTVALVFILIMVAIVTGLDYRVHQAGAGGLRLSAADRRAGHGGLPCRDRGSVHGSAWRPRPRWPGQRRAQRKSYRVAT